MGIRSLEIGELLEAVDPIDCDASMCVGKFKCRAANDALEGFVNLSSTGKRLLEPWSVFYICVKETVLTDALSIAKSRTVRRDAKRGWASLIGNSGQHFLEPLR